MCFSMRYLLLFLYDVLLHCVFFLFIHSIKRVVEHKFNIS